MSTLEELKAKLAQYLAGSEGHRRALQGHRPARQGCLGRLRYRRRIAGSGRQVGGARQWHKLVELWVRGLAFDWTGLYGDVPPRRISLPTYPFAKERYWPMSNDSGLPSRPIAKLEDDAQLRRWESLLAEIEIGALSADAALALAVQE
ncbi:hypothetical protein [Variovorax sp. NFACC26]|uniref:hypothetical protein n=1 Tax=Variovorax sp. NFACC26 TaxID=1566275 RepID=UPI003AAA4824